MKSDVIRIDNQGNGFEAAVDETSKVAAYRGLKQQDSVRLQVIAQEMLSMARSVTGEMKASFWIEAEDTSFELHLATETVMDKEKRAMLISASSSRTNEAAKGFLGKLRDSFEQAMAADADHSGEEIPYDMLQDVGYRINTDADWDGYERSILRELADNVKIAIRGDLVDMTVIKCFLD